MNAGFYHNEGKSRFDYSVGDQLAVCEYVAQEGDTVWRFTHTYVPESMRGTGVAAGLVRFALDHVANHGIKIIPVCSFVSEYIARHPEYKRLILPGRSS